MNGSTRRAGLSPAKLALLQERLKGRGPRADAPADDVITRAAGDGPEYPTSFMQEQMWLVTQLEPEKAVYNVPVAVLVRADADVGCLERAFTEVVRRHEGLRTVFRVVEGEVRQIVLPPFPVRCEVRDLRHRVGDDFERDVRRIVTEEGARFMDVSRGPLVRMSLLRVTEAECALVITIHHIVTDGWAYPLLLNELWTFYAALRRGEALPELPLPALRYVDYAVWQRKHLTGDTLRRHVDWWRDHLAGAPETELVGDRPRPARMTYRGAFHHFTIDERTTALLRALCLRETVTMNMVLSAAFAATVAHCTGQWDVVIGSLFGNRSRLELQDVVGCFVNSAALRIDLTDGPGLTEAAKRARRLILEADQHQELPFETVVETLKVERDPSRNPLFQLMYFHHTFVPSHVGPVDHGLAMRQVYEDNRAALVDTGLAKLDLSLATLEDGTRMTGVAEYSTELFDPATMDRFCRHFCVLLAQAAADPERPLPELTLLDDAERRTLLEGWSRGPARDEDGAPYHRRFEAWAARTPDAPALVAGAERLTYAQLNARANRLARRLRTLGVGPEQLVAVSLEKSAALVVAQLAVSKAGGAYVPIDPAYPAERRRWMLEDTAARVVLTSSALAPALPDTGAAVLALDALEPALAGEDGTDLDVEVGPAHAAYVIFTSGSTGRPKGVLVPHRGVTNLADASRGFFRVEPGTPVLQFASFSFDAAVWDVANALLSGACLVVAEGDAAKGGEPLLELMRRERVALALLTPGLMSALPADGLPDLRTVTSGGEAIPVDVARRWSQGRRLVNAYGPTETTIAATVAVEPDVTGGRVPIGRPVDNVRALVLDARMRPLPVGVPGELYLGGAGVARGYVGRPGATAERFVPDPFEPGARLYRTGDVVRWRADGALEFIGRADRQVKVRGFRIEPGEVETALRAHPGVREAAVLVREQGGTRRLVAYVAAGGEVTPDALRAALRATLPEYMVPGAFVRLDALPRLPNGKLDARALPAPEPAQAEEGGAALPRTETEAILARVWAQVLGRESVGVHDNFFELGGDSILAIQGIARAAREGVRIALRQVFTHQTIAELAEAAETAPPPVAEQGPVVGPAPLTPAQAWMLAGGLPRPDHWNMAVALEARAPLDPAVLERAAEAVLAHHDALRTRFERTADGWAAFTVAPEPVSFDRFDVSALDAGAQEAEMEALAARVQTGMDLARGPLFRVALFERGAGRPARILVAAHHLVVDAVSLPVLAEDLEAAYRRLASGADASLPPKTTAFRDWARKLEERARSAGMEGQLAVWREALPDAHPPLALDDPAAPDAERDTAAVFVALTEDETRGLLEEVPAAYGTQANDALLAALAEAFRAWDGRDSVLVDVEGHGREDLFEDVDLSRTVGWFTALYPVHLRALGTPGETLAAAKETLRAVPERGIGYGLLRWLGAPEAAAALAAKPAAEVSFNYLGQGGVAGAPPADADPLLVPAAGPVGPVRDPGTPRTHRLTVEGAVQGGVLRMGFFHAPGVLRTERVERLAAAYADALRALVAHCRAGGAAAYTPADFPEAGVDQGELDAILAQLDGL